MIRRQQYSTLKIQFIRNGALGFQTLGTTIVNTSNMLDESPLFVDAENGDFRLSEYSTAIGAGISSGAPVNEDLRWFNQGLPLRILAQI